MSMKPARLVMRWPAEWPLKTGGPETKFINFIRKGKDNQHVFNAIV
jgi:hypothetical protein